MKGRPQASLPLQRDKWLLLIPLFLVFILSGCAPPSLFPVGKPDPLLRWRTFKTPHFAIHYHQGEEALAARAAEIAEEVHARLTSDLRWEPRGSTQLVLIDRYDESNGFSTPFPYNAILITASAPSGGELSGLENQDDWLRLVITHEYAHILHLDIVEGAPKALQYIFGRLYFPNLWQPLWIIEGVPTYQETKQTSGGRGRSNLFEMILRMAALEGRLNSLDQASSSLVSWPGGMVPYLYGVMFHQYLAERYGEEKLSEIAHNYGSRLVPFLVNRSAKQVLGRDYQALWAEWQSELRKKYVAQMEEVRAAGLSPTRRLTLRGYLISEPALSPDGQSIAYSEYNQDEYPSLRLIQAGGRGDRALCRRNWGEGISWAPDGKKIAFSQYELYWSFSSYQDLYLHDLEREKTIRLTRGLRARDPDISPDGGQVLFVINHLGTNDLATLNLATRQITTLTHNQERIQYSKPRWSPDGKRIAVSMRREGGPQDILLLDQRGEEIARLTQDRSLDTGPSWSPDGRYLFFSSDRTGVYNLYAFSLEEGCLYQVSNVLGGAFYPDCSADGRQLAFIGYSAKGFDLYTMEVAPEQWRRVESGVRVAQDLPAPEPAGPSPSPPSVRSHSYNPLPTLWPRFWVPWFGQDERGLQVGGLTLGADTLAQHQYLLQAYYGARSHRWAYDLQYTNDQFYPTLKLGVSDRAALYSDLLRRDEEEDEGRDYWERQRTLSAEVGIPLYFIASGQVLFFGYRRQELDRLSQVPSWTKRPEEGDLAGLHLRWLYSNAQRYGFSISPEEGRTISLSYERMDDRLGSDFNLDRYLGDWREYVNIPFRHQVLALRLLGGYAKGDLLRQRAFQMGGLTGGVGPLQIEDQEIFLRGYPEREFRGQRMAAGSLEYRFPIWNIERGRGTWPFFLQRLHGAGFVDCGNAWDHRGDFDDFKVGVGVEGRLNLEVAYAIPLQLRLILARGLQRGGETQMMLGLGASF
ncbi:MAG: BamA/TamA family outer membrane protein [bacterium]